MEMNFSEEEIEILKLAVVEYESNYYISKDQEWQKVINRLIARLTKVGE